jgi:hypothetical protein
MPQERMKIEKIPEDEELRGTKLRRLSKVTESPGNGVGLLKKIAVERFRRARMQLNHEHSSHAAGKQRPERPYIAKNFHEVTRWDKQWTYTGCTSRSRLRFTTFFHN